jgi:chorismate mutase
MKKVSDIFKEILKIKQKSIITIEDKARIQQLQQKLEQSANFKLKA